MSIEQDTTNRNKNMIYIQLVEIKPPSTFRASEQLFTHCRFHFFLCYDKSSLYNINTMINAWASANEIHTCFLSLETKYLPLQRLAAIKD